MRRHSHPPPTEVRLCLREPNGRSLPRFRLAACRQRPGQRRAAPVGGLHRRNLEPLRRPADQRGAPVPLAVARSAQGAGLLRPGRRHLRPEGNPVRVAEVSLADRRPGLRLGAQAQRRGRLSLPRRALPARRPDIPLRLFPRGLRGAGAGRDAARGGPDRCAPAAPLRLRLDPAHHPHAAPRRRQAGRHASPRTGLRPAGTLPQGLRPAGEGALPRPVRHRDLGGLGLRPADRAVFLEQRNGRRGPPGPGHRRMPLLLPAEPLVRREGPQVRRVAGVVPRHALRCRRWLCAEGLAAGSGGLYLDARRGAGGRPACRPGAQPRPVARTFEAGPGPDRADPAGDDPALAPGRVAAAAGLGPPQRQPRLALVAWPRSRPLEPVGQETRVKLHRSVQRRLDECPDYRPCNLPALERCDLIDDSPLLDGYR